MTSSRGVVCKFKKDHNTNDSTEVCISFIYFVKNNPRTFPSIRTIQLDSEQIKIASQTVYLKLIQIETQNQYQKNNEKLHIEEGDGNDSIFIEMVSNTIEKVKKKKKLNTQKAKVQ